MNVYLVIMLNPVLVYIETFLAVANLIAFILQTDLSALQKVKLSLTKKRCMRHFDTGVIYRERWYAYYDKLCLEVSKTGPAVQ